MKRVIILQARMGSSRLPGKVLKELGGRPMLVQELRRLKQCQHVDEIVLATTTHSRDDCLIKLADNEGIRWFRGSEEDVLSRYIRAALEARADLVVRITADCPLIDAEQVDRVIAELQDHEAHCDYASNVLKRTFPRGLDTEALFRDVLERIGRLAVSRAAREHVTYFLVVERPELFLRKSVEDVEDNSDLRWTVDTQEDLNMITALYEDLGLAEKPQSYRDIVRFVRQNPSIARLNQQIAQKLV